MTQIRSIRLRSNTATNAASSNPVLDADEPGYETDTYRLKVGDGSTAWNSLQEVGAKSFVPQVGRSAQDTMRASRDSAYAAWDSQLSVAARTPTLYVYGHSYVDPAASGASDAAHSFTTILGASIASARPGAVSVAEGHSGYTSAQLLTAFASSTFVSQPVGAVGAFVLLALTNDFYTGVAPATSKSNLQAIIAAARADNSSGPHMPVLLVVEPERSDTFTPVAAWSAYQDAARQVADADPYTAIIDLGARLGTTTPDPYALFQSDHVHPTDAGHAFIAAIIAAELLRGRTTLAPHGAHASLPAALPPVAQSGWAGVTRDTDNAVIRYSDGAINNSLSYQFSGLSGHYSIALDHRAQPNCGKYDLYLNGALQGAGASWDGYAASNADVYELIAGFYLPASGLHTLTLTMGSKNASSSAYAGVLRGIYVTRTGD